MTEKRIIDDAFMELTDIHSKSTALQALANYLQCSLVSAQDLDYDSVLSVFETALNYISVQLGDILTRIEVRCNLDGNCLTMYLVARRFIQN